MTAYIVENSTSSAVINYGCALLRLRFADRRYSVKSCFCAKPPLAEGRLDKRLRVTSFCQILETLTRPSPRGRGFAQKKRFVTVAAVREAQAR